MNFRITGLSPGIFTDFFGQLGDELKKLNIIRYSAGAANAFPCRITLQDAAIGDSLLLVNYEHQPAQNAYQSRHAIYVNERATHARTRRLPASPIQPTPARPPNRQRAVPK